MLILKDLWMGNIDPGKIDARQQDYIAASQKYADQKQELYQILSPEMQVKFDDLQTKESEICIMNEYAAFEKGFRMGAKMMLDILGDYSL